MDVFVKEKIGDEYVYVVDSKNPVLKSVPRKYHEEKAVIKFNGKEYSVPKDYEGYLTYCYGDWKTPVKEWDYRTSGGCFKKEL